MGPPRPRTSAGSISKPSSKSNWPTLDHRTAATRYRDLKQLFRWLLDESEIDRNPMERMRPPKLDECPVPFIPDSTIRSLLSVCSGRSFEDRRDTVILFVLVDTGARLSEVADLRLDEDLDLEFDELHVPGKGRRGRTL